MLGFMRSLLSVKGKQVGDDLVKAIVEIDPEAATEAEMLTMQRDLDRAGEVLQKLRVDYNREVKESEAAGKSYDELMAAAELLKKRYEDPALPPPQKAEVEKSFGTVVARLEEMAPKVEQERKDAEEVKALLDDAEKVFRDKAMALTTARQNLERAKHDMQHALLQEQRAKEQAARAAELAGLKGQGGNQINTALDAMHRRADEARAAAETARTKAEVFASAASPAGDDKLVAEALAQVRGQAALPAGAQLALPGSGLADRLAALKGGK